MAHFPPVYSNDESAILIAIYEEPAAQYTAYTLTQLLSQNTKPGTPEHLAAFKRVCSAIEELVEKGLVQGTRLKGADGVYYSDLKLRYKGEQEAIRERKRVAEIERQMPKWIEDANKVAEEIRQAQEKDKKK